jgi:hypothetical protein
MRAITVSLVPGTVTQRTAYINMDNYATAVLGVQVVCSGGANFWLAHSFDDPNDLVNPVPLANMFWDNSLLPPSVDVSNMSVSFAIMATPLWFRLAMTNNVGAIRATFLQVGEHSHSNISQGPFAPPILGAASMGEGSNYGAMAK